MPRKDIVCPHLNRKQFYLLTKAPFVDRNKAIPYSGFWFPSPRNVTSDNTWKGCNHPWPFQRINLKLCCFQLCSFWCWSFLRPPRSYQVISCTCHHPSNSWHNISKRNMRKQCMCKHTQLLWFYMTQVKTENMLLTFLFRVICRWSVEDGPLLKHAHLISVLR